jgi:WD40 repeat protein
MADRPPARVTAVARTRHHPRPGGAAGPSDGTCIFARRDNVPGRDTDVSQAFRSNHLLRVYNYLFSPRSRGAALQDMVLAGERFPGTIRASYDRTLPAPRPKHGCAPGFGRGSLMPDANEEIPPGFTLLHTLRGHKRRVIQIAWSPDGGMIASPSDDYTVRLWDAGTGLLLRTLSGHRREVGSVAWSPDGRSLASGSHDKTVRVWDSATGKLRKTLGDHRETVRSVSWSPDGQTLASGSVDQMVRLWDVNTWALRCSFPNRDWIPRIAWSPDSQVLAVASDDGTVQLWNPTTRVCLSTLWGHHSPPISTGPNYLTEQRF